QGDAVYTSSLFFDTTDHDQQVSDTAVASVTFLLPVGPEQYLKHTFTLAGQSYTLEHAWEVVGLRSVLDATPIRFVWNDHIKRAEKDLKACRNKTTINYYLANDKFNALKEHASTSQERLLNSPVQWVGIKQRFFTAAIIAHTPFASGYVATTPTPQSTTTVKEAKMRLALPEVAPNEDPKGTFTFYFGPNDYYTLKQVTKGFAKNIYLGWPVVRWINHLLIMPLFTLLELYVSSYGLIIVLLVLVIKSLLLPLSYRSYISMAKMRVLKPSIDALKAKHGNDTQKIQIAQMNLYREMGINPLSGCIPVLLQMPILLAMFNFFPNAIALRQQAFLWANDLSTYDAILQLPFTIPAYGSHVSLFTLLMTASTILYTWSNNELAASQDGPMKMITYLMPLTFMFILNSFPAGLSFYYFVSNLVTFGQQSLIKRFVDEDKLLKKLEANRVANKDRKKSRFQLRLEEAMKTEGNKKPRPSKKNRPKK
ncbi:MAG: membrane protein insertase YidC, partial [Bacteroidota bacterium]